MYHRRYEKVFLMLRQETAGYALGKRPPWGSCVMELKNGMGRLQISVQGLRPLRGGGYEVYVLAGEESIFCGRLYPDAREGHGTLKWDFSPDAVGDGKQAEDMHTVVVLAEYGKNGCSAPLTASFGEKRDWRSIFTPRSAVQEQAEDGIALQAAEAAAPIQTEPQQDTNASIAQAQGNGYHGSFQGLLARFRLELEELEQTGVLSAQQTAEIRGIGETASPQPQAEAPAEMQPQEEAPSETQPQAEAPAEMPPQETSTAETQPQAEAPSETQPQETSPADALFGTGRVLYPFADGEAWRCIALEELTLLAQIPLRWQKEFFFLLPYRRYHHLIAQEREEGIWLGLPDSYRQEDAAQARAFGFAQFRPVDADWGYWMCFLEKEN